MNTELQPAARSRFRGVVFDMDGVLCDSEPFICEAAMRMFAETYRFQVRPEDFLPFVGAGENRYLGGVAEQYGIAWDQEEDKRRTYEIYLEIIRGRLKPLAGVGEFISQCRRAGILLAVATSADAVKMHGNLAEIGLPPETFDACVNGLEVVHKKPAPDIFLLAIQRLDLAPGECLVVEDAPNGIRAGKAAGAKCLGLTTSFPAAELQVAGADWTAPDLAHVAPEVLSLRPGSTACPGA
ncbi:MAG: HAD-IA family hydrolase [Thermoguttaceae bacterium]|jgi:HAD superfamily hydrolase (TIGR01509 family)|nr:HAD-IA family hydrolase [Thermoguttaceae bacterium]